MCQFKTRVLEAVTIIEIQIGQEALVWFSAIVFTGWGRSLGDQGFLSSRRFGHLGLGS
jgi:hypothetical protein